MQAKDSSKILSSISIMVMAYSIQFNLFPAYSELEGRTNGSFLKSSTMATLFMFFGCVFMGICGVWMFRDGVNADILVNFKERSGLTFLFCRLALAVVLIFHVPYVFYAAKECMLVIYDEVMYQSLSKKIDAKLALTNESEERRDEG